MICDDRSNESNVKDIEKENDVIEIEEIDNDTDNEDNETIESGTEDSDNEDIEDLSKIIASGINFAVHYGVLEGKTE